MTYCLLASFLQDQIEKPGNIWCHDLNLPMSAVLYIKKQLKSIWILCLLCRVSELLGCMSFGVCSLIDPDKVSLNEQIRFPNTFLHSGFPLFSNLRLRFVCSSIGPWMFRVQLAMREFEWPQYLGGGNTSRSAVSSLSPADTGATTCLCHSRNSNVTDRTRPDIIVLQFPCSIAVYHVGNNAFVTPTGVTLWKTWVFTRGKNVTLTDFELQ